MKKIIFSASNDIAEEILEPPKASINFLPEWYKKMSTRIDPKNPSYLLDPKNTNSTVKSCIPVFDSISAGYMITLPCDVQFVDPEIFSHRVIWDVSWQVVSSHGEEQIGEMSVPEEYERTPLKWEGSWNIRTPNGYSLLYTHPFYRYDLPFISATGIVDSDVHDLAINIPFFIKKNFFGIIPMGTPIAQIIPIKRDSWVSEREGYQYRNGHRLDKVKLKLKKSYKERFWQKKYYR